MRTVIKALQKRFLVRRTHGSGEIDETVSIAESGVYGGIMRGFPLPCLRRPDKTRQRRIRHFSAPAQIGHPYGWPFALSDAWQFPTLAWGDPTLPSALRRFTSEFGMGSGGTTALRPPGKFCLSTRPVPTCRCNLYQAENLLSIRQNTFGVVRLSLTVH